MNCSNCQNPIAEGEKSCVKCGGQSSMLIQGDQNTLSSGNRWLKIATIFSLIINPFAIILSVPLIFAGIFVGDSGSMLAKVVQIIFLCWPFIIVPAFVVSIVFLVKKRYKIALALSVLGNVELLIFLAMVFSGGGFIEGSKDILKAVKIFF